MDILKDFLFIGLCGNSWLWFHILGAAIGVKFFLLKTDWSHRTIILTVLALALGWEFIEFFLELGGNLNNALAIYGSTKNWLLDTLGDIFGAMSIAGIMLYTDKIWFRIKYGNLKG
jgi:hypothetical protein